MKFQKDSDFGSQLSVVGYQFLKLEFVNLSAVERLNTEYIICHPKLVKGFE